MGAGTAPAFACTSRVLLLDDLMKVCCVTITPRLNIKRLLTYMAYLINTKWLLAVSRYAPRRLPPIQRKVMVQDTGLEPVTYCLWWQLLDSNQCLTIWHVAMHATLSYATLHQVTEGSCSIQLS